MLNVISSSVFSDSESIVMTPVVSAEWNNNLFNPPYITVAGSGEKITNALFSGTVSPAGNKSHPSFETKSFAMANKTGSVSYKATGLQGGAYKVITYIKTDNAQPVMISAYGKSSVKTSGSTQEEASSLSWTRIETYVNIESSDSGLDLVYTIVANATAGANINPTVYFTLPEIYETSIFDYNNHSLWPTETPFKNFRPGESYIGSGNTICSFPSDYRKITKSPIEGIFYQPTSSILQNPSLFYLNPRVPLMKTALPSITSSFKYFVSDYTDRSITARYEKLIPVNKLVVKMNTTVTKPTINIKINDQNISVGDSENITMPEVSTGITNGVLVLYWNGSSWSTNKWSTMPKFSDSGSLSPYTTVNRITVTQVSKSVNSPFDTYSGEDPYYFDNDLDRMQMVEISPRLEVDLSDFVEGFSVDKSIDSKSSSLPISGINSNTASVQLSGIPPLNNGAIVPIFSSQNNSISSPLTSMLRKGIKFYLGYKVQEYSIQSTTVSNLSTYIPAGVFYSDSWDEKDISTISISCFDISRYLQSLPAQDHVVKGKTAFDTVTDVLELAGFTDYDFDSLYSVCNNSSQPVDIYHYSVYSKDTTLIGSLNELLTPYQIAAYIDEYGIMKFLSLHSMISSSTSSLTISDSHIKQGGFSVSNKAKPGKISIKFAQPRTKQSLSVQNVQDVQTLESASSIYIRSNDILWQQQKVDAVGFTYVKNGTDEKSNELDLNVNDLQDIFRTFNRDSSGYLVVEDEVMSYEYKEYELQARVTIPAVNSGTITGVTGSGSVVTYTASNTFSVGDSIVVSGVTPSQYNISGTITERTAQNFKIASSATGTFQSGGTATKNTQLVTELVSIKNDLDLQSAINTFIKTYDIKIKDTSSAITNAEGDGNYVIYTAENSFKQNDLVKISGINPSAYNITGLVYSATSSDFVLISSAFGDYVSGGVATSDVEYDLKVTPTGKLLNVQRGMFGTSPNEHKRITDLSSKGLVAKKYNIFTDEVSNASTSIIDNKTEYSKLPSLLKIKLYGLDNSEDIYVMPEDHIDPGYQTYSTKFNLTTSNFSSGGLVFNMSDDFTNKIMVILYKDSLIDPKTETFYDPPRYKYSMSMSEFIDGTEHFIAFADVTAQCNSIFKYVPKVAKQIAQDGKLAFEYHSDDVFDLQVVYNLSHGEDGEDGTENDPKNIIYVYLNNIQITGWNVLDPDYSDTDGDQEVGYKPIERNAKTGLLKNISMDVFNPAGTKFGFVTMVQGYFVPYLYTPQESGDAHLSSLREIHATEKPLLSRSVNYIYQDTEFLDGIVQNKPVGSLYKTYVMQTTPEVRFINMYDVEYGIPAATTAQHSAIHYMMNYYADNDPQSESDRQKLKVSEYDVSYSTILNTGHSGKFAIANNSNYLVYIQKESDAATSVSTKFTIWTNEAVVPSDPELVEKIIDPTNASEVVQLDSKWIQSKAAAQKLMKLIELAMDGFSKDVSLVMFGNPLLQLGDVVTLSYSLNGISLQKYVVTGMTHQFDTGLETSIRLNRIPQ
jgi:hypothetical protein